jgi:hypothetical protein
VIEPKGREATRWRKQRFDLLERLRTIPREALPGTLTESRTRCGKESCHCAGDEGHRAWSLTFMVKGRRRVERIPQEWAEEVRRRVEEGRGFKEAVSELLAANAELLILSRRQRRR